MRGQMVSAQPDGILPPLREFAPAAGPLRSPRVADAWQGLAPWPGDAAWAHQGTHVEGGVAAVAGRANPGGKLHHSYLALCPGTRIRACRSNARSPWGAAVEARARG